MKSKSLFNFDKSEKENFSYLIGTDEAGRGCGAGPVCAAAVCFKNADEKLIEKLCDIDDSKKLSPKKREELFEIIIDNSFYSINFGSVEDIEKYNILKTSLMTMKKSCNEVISLIGADSVKVLIDGNKLIPGFFEKENETKNQKAIVKGDSKSASIAAASILAKVSRDRLMNELDIQYPQYCWKENKGYLTKAHLKAVDKYGLCIHHRKKYFEKHFETSKQLLLI